MVCLSVCHSLFRLHAEHLCIYIQDEQWQAGAADLALGLRSAAAASERKLSHLIQSMEKRGQEVESWIISSEEEMAKLRAQGAEALALQMDLITQIDDMQRGAKELRYQIAITRHEQMSCFYNAFDSLLTIMLKIQSHNWLSRMFNINIHVLFRVETTTNQSLEMIKKHSFIFCGYSRTPKDSIYIL